jgi:3-phenylpropionate/trans-cinnamate dioxygenase ferredoxin subunit
MARHVIGPVETVPVGERKILDVGGRSIGIFNVNGSLYALANRCPHAGGPLCQGEVSGTACSGDTPYAIEWVREGEIVRCPWHAWEFDITTGRTVSDPQLKVRSYPVMVEDGNIVVEE